MKQPELGKKVASLRKERGLTQEELVEKCNINVRTIQRIESGEVTPRNITLRLIFEVLNYDFKMLNEELSNTVSSKSFFSFKGIQYFFLIGFESSKNISYSAKQLQLAWIAGLIFFLIGFPVSGMDYAQYYNTYDPNLNLIYTLVKIVSFLSLVVLMRGFIIIGDFKQNYLIKISSYLIIIHGLFLTIYDISSVFFKHIQSEYADGGVAITYGAILFLFGVSLLKIKQQFGRIANITGIIAIVTSFLFITLIFWWVGLLLLIPVEIFEIVILYKGYEMFVSEKSIPDC